MKYAITLLFLILFMSCKNETSKENLDIDRNLVNDEVTKTTNYNEDNGNFEEQSYDISNPADSINRNWDLEDTNRQKMLFTTFDMSEIQIQQYKNELKKWSGEETEDHYKRLSANERIDKEKDILKSILNDSQFKRYKDWANENDNR